MQTATDSITTCRIRLDLPEDLIDLYTSQADSQGMTLDEILIKRLTDFSGQTALKPLYFDDSDRQYLESLIGKNVSTPNDALNSIKSALSISLTSFGNATVRVSLKPHLLSRLKARCFKQPFPEFLMRTVQQELERFCGMR